MIERKYIVVYCAKTFDGELIIDKTTVRRPKKIRAKDIKGLEGDLSMHLIEKNKKLDNITIISWYR